MLVASDKTTGVMPKTYSIAGDQVATMALKGLEIAKANTASSFDFLRSLLGAKSLNEVIGLQTAYTKTMFETFAGQMTDFQHAMQKTASEMAAPSRSAWESAATGNKAA
jgi:hypothetical protein